MDLIQRTISSNDFGLRKIYPWGKRSQSDIKTKVDCANIDPMEKLYLGDILSGAIANIHETSFIGRVENPYLWCRYVLQYEEMKADQFSKNVKEKIVIHVTSISAAYEIADKNFDWRLVSRHRFGQGVSFAKTADYAVGQAKQKDAYIVSGILVANSDTGFYNTEIPPWKLDTTTNSAKSVYVKYMDNDFYPYYIVY